MIQVVLPAHLRTLAQVSAKVELDVEGPATQRTVLDALEARYPALRGTIRDHVTHRRRPFVRFFVGEQDVSHEPACRPHLFNLFLGLSDNHCRCAQPLRALLNPRD